MRNRELAIAGATLLCALACSDRRLRQEVGGQGGTVDGSGGSGGSGAGGASVSGAGGGRGGSGGSGSGGRGSGGVGGSGGISGATGGAGGGSGCLGGGWCDGVPDAAGCCPPDSTNSGCMRIGGYSPQGCYITCDFFCSTNWRVEPDAHGCPAWRYDFRSPAPGENSLCFPGWDAMPDRGETRDAEAEDLRAVDAADASD